MSTLRYWANALTVLRAISGLPLILALCFGNFEFAWILFLIAGLTDYADGKLARKAGGGTSWGARLDPLSDKILISAPLIWLGSEGVLPIWSIWLIVTRELVVSLRRSREKDGVPASIGGKLKTLLQFMSILLMIWPVNWGGVIYATKMHEVGWWIYWISLIVAIESAISYFKD